MSVNRKTARDALATLLSAALVGTGKPVATVLSYPPDAFSGITFPLCYIESAGSDRENDTNTGNKSIFDFDPVVMIPYIDADSGRTAPNPEDALDAIELLIAQTVQNRDNQNVAAWTWVKFREKSKTDFVKIGKVYRVEYFFLSVKMRDI